MSSPLMLVLPMQRSIGWPPKHAHWRPTVGEVMPASEALTRSFHYDAHFVPYAPSTTARVRKVALEQQLIAIGLYWVAFDVDDPLMHARGEPARSGWRAEFEACMRNVLKVHAGLLFWHTRGGARILGRLPGLQLIDSAEGWEKWRILYLCWCEYLRLTFRIECDRTTAQPAQEFRLPRATRPTNLEPDDYGPVVGDPSNIGVWEPGPMGRFLRALPRAERRLSLGDSWPQLLPNGAPWNPRQVGLLAQLLMNRGLINPRDAHGQVSVPCGCPSGIAHPRSESDTIVWLPKREDDLGKIFCNHNRCASVLGRGTNAADQLKLFTDEEVRRALIDVTGVTPL